MGIAIKSKLGTRPGTTANRNTFIRKATGGVEVVHISAKEGDPSTFWKSASGKYYLTKSEAVNDNGNAVNPDDYRIDVSFFTKYKTYILGALVAACVAAAVIYFAPVIATKLNK